MSHDKKEVYTVVTAEEPKRTPPRADKDGQVDCPYPDCYYTGKRRSYNTHVVNAHGPYVKCNWNGCFWEGSRSRFNDHYKNNHREVGHLRERSVSPKRNDKEKSSSRFMKKVEAEKVNDEVKVEDGKEKVDEGKGDSARKVKEVLAELELSNLTDEFMRQKITDEDAPTLTADELIQLGVSTIGQRIKFFKRFADKEKEENPSSKRQKKSE